MARQPDKVSHCAYISCSYMYVAEILKSLQPVKYFYISGPHSVMSQWCVGQIK